MPFVFKFQAAFALNINSIERAGHGVEACRSDNRVNRVFFAVRPHTVRSDLFNTGLCNIYQRDITSVISFEIACIRTNPLSAKYGVR